MWANTKRTPVCWPFLCTHTHTHTPGDVWPRCKQIGHVTTAVWHSNDKHFHSYNSTALLWQYSEEFTIASRQVDPWLTRGAETTAGSFQCLHLTDAISLWLHGVLVYRLAYWKIPSWSQTHKSLYGHVHKSNWEMCWCDTRYDCTTIAVTDHSAYEKTKTPCILFAALSDQTAI